MEVYALVHSKKLWANQYESVKDESKKEPELEVPATTRAVSVPDPMIVSVPVSITVSVPNSTPTSSLKSLRSYSPRYRSLRIREPNITFIQATKPGSPPIVTFKRDNIENIPSNFKERAEKDGNVSIGPNGTTISLAVLQNLDFNSGSQVTRKLLSQIFSRETLSTHNLSGKPSPAFKPRTPKERLDPLKIEDITHFVTTFTKISKREVRLAITTKCADESKISKNRHKRFEVTLERPEFIMDQS